MPIAPPRRQARPTDGLWKRTCFEAFLAAPRKTAYREFNFTISGRWAAYDFSAYRQRRTDARLQTAPAIRVRASKNRLELTAFIARNDWKLFAPLPRIGLSAVVEEAACPTYWALRHPGGRPDFHCRCNFIQTIARSRLPWRAP